MSNTVKCEYLIHVYMRDVANLTVHTYVHSYYDISLVGGFSVNVIVVSCFDLHIIIPKFMYYEWIQTHFESIIKCMVFCTP